MLRKIHEFESGCLAFGLPSMGVGIRLDTTVPIAGGAHPGVVGRKGQACNCWLEQLQEEGQS
jgi:hypothetical protein